MKFSKEWRRALSKAKHGRPLSEANRRGISAALTGKPNPKSGEARKGKRRPNFTGINHPMWRGGHKEFYPKEFDNAYKEMIRQRDEYICQLCFLPQNGRRLAVHHIDYNKQNMDPAMKVSLHTGCHMKATNGDRVAYRLYFEDLQRSRGYLSKETTDAR